MSGIGCGQTRKGFLGLCTSTYCVGEERLVVNGIGSGSAAFYETGSSQIQQNDTNFRVVQTFEYIVTRKRSIHGKRFFFVDGEQSSTFLTNRARAAPGPVS
jgi:hypothetical protein